MKKGDKVRFLNAIGGGKVKGFQANGMILIEDEDGFECPYPENELVVIPTIISEKEKSNIKIELINEKDKKNTKIKVKEEKKPEIVIETKEGNNLNVFIAFIPEDIDRLEDTSYNAYILNSSNYFLNYNIATIDGKEATSQSYGTIEPNIKLLFYTLTKDDLNKWMKLNVQLFAYKQKPYEQKPVVDKEFKLSPVKFYKKNSFKENEYIDEKAILLTIIRNDNIFNEIDNDKVQINITQKAKTDRSDKSKNEGEKQFTKTNEESYKIKNGIIEIDLHINNLLDNTIGMSSADILQYQKDKFNEVMMKYRNQKGKKIIFIHGKGDGILRKEILKELNHKYSSCYAQDASFKEYGFGATQVTIK